MDEQAARNLASQLRQPTGEEGIKTGNWMNQGNKHINLDTLAVLKACEYDSILEIGMGNGYFVKEILSKHPTIEYTGCDFSEVMILEAQRINKEWIERGQAQFIFSDVSSLPLPDKSFNKIFTINTIYFWKDTTAVLNELKRVLKQGGSLIITVRPKHQMEKYPFTRFGFNMFSKEDMITLLVANGFTIKDCIEIKEPDYEANGQIVKMENLIIEVTI